MGQACCRSHAERALEANADTAFSYSSVERPLPSSLGQSAKQSPPRDSFLVSLDGKIPRAGACVMKIAHSGALLKFNRHSIHT